MCGSLPDGKTLHRRLRAPGYTVKSKCTNNSIRKWFMTLTCLRQQRLLSP